MGGTVFTSGDFTVGDDTFIYTPSGVFLKTAPGSTAILASDGGVTTDSGSDTVVGAGNFAVIEPPVVGGEDLAKIQDLDLYEFAGVSLTGDLNMGPPELDVGDSELVPLTDDDVLVGAIGIFHGLDRADMILGVGIYAVGQTISTGDGNDIIAGLVSLEQKTGAFEIAGVFSEQIDTGNDDDIIVGASRAVIGEELHGGFVVQGEQYGLEANIIDTGSGSDIVAGAVLAEVGDNTNLLQTGMLVNSLTLRGSQEGPTEDFNAALGIAAVTGLPEPDEPTQDALGQADNVTIESVGLSAGSIESGGSPDVILGLVLADLGDDSSLVNSSGIESGFLNAGDGENIIVGAVYAEFGTGGILGDNSGLNVSQIMTGSGNDTIIGFVGATSGDALDHGLNVGIRGSTFEEDNTISSGAGEDIIIGITDIGDIIDAEEETVGAQGLRDVSIDAGDQNDIVIGIGGAEATGNITQFGAFGIVNTPQKAPPPPDVDADLPPGQVINLGGGDDFVFARGGDGGLYRAVILGEEGNDVFDVHSGTGSIYGGDDMDTLILSGNFADFDFDEAAEADADIANGDFVLITNEGTNTEIFAYGIEFYQFDDALVAYGDLPLLA